VKSPKLLERHYVDLEKTMNTIRTIPCACCLRPKYRETNRRALPGHYTRMRLRGWCACVEDARGFTIKLGPLKKGIL
jgi:hypothetical protein